MASDKMMKTIQLILIEPFIVELRVGITHEDDFEADNLIDHCNQIFDQSFLTSFVNSVDALHETNNLSN